ncbi:class C sortase [Enterococcus hirae]|nr:class C sortase [Enterococcus hirae]
MSQKQRPKKWIRIVMYLLFLTGGLIASYPFYVNAFNQLVDHYRINESQKTKAEQQQARERAKKYNQELAERGMGAITLPTYTGRKEADLANYLANHLIGSIQIPKIRISVPLFDHASPTILQYGAGVLEGTSYPTGGKNNHSVISAHSGIPERKLFTDLDQLELEDIFIITYAEEKLAYEVNDITIVTPDDVSSLKIYPEEDLVTLVTCTPYMINSHRLLVRGHRVPYTEELAQKEANAEQRQWWLNLMILLILLLFVGSLSLFILRVIREKPIE